ncbi:helix-turn-helix domain-containing protein [Swaminathania salitolerans]|uniref:HTH cro/C1-type domain-containing protein n=1 Tax=Swaminathania salitolerans TaxID=182838 RepID=A0A511BST0_9PROT|nr:helix-turn-helix transcriptional regulator [Swaminathania salitolerans]GBQ09375.1 transcriptional regulator [Swaminathania salitolerans LMG 21291]GEL00998.1 hypothetical protein SSA02_01610 [Swaminathania salitolerans]
MSVTTPGGLSPSTALTRRIAMLRKSQGMSQQQLADALGVSRSAVAFWETGRVGSLRKYIPKLADLFGVSTEAFLTGMIEEDIPAILSPDENDLIQLYRALKPEYKLTAQKWMERQVHKQSNTRTERSATPARATGSRHAAS